VKGFFVAGTDTGVGKTEVARALCALLARRGLKPAALKPVETGCEPGAPQDALLLRAACGPPGNALPLDRVCPYRFRMPAAPLVAAEAEGRRIDLLAIEALVERAGYEGVPIVVEAAGGLLVPLARENASGSIEQADSAERAAPPVLVTNLDLAQRLGLPVVLVGRAGLGTLNHCALSAAALEQRGLELTAIVLNRLAAQDDPTVASNARWAAELTGARVLGPTPFVAEAGARPAALAELLEPLVAA
jgi:dethiobiotin synthetase